MEKPRQQRKAASSIPDSAGREGEAEDTSPKLSQMALVTDWQF
jgi:hypothetical protein